jgi:lipoprotein signal peptidase
MHILVIGRTQFIGPYIVRRLVALGHQVTLLSRRHSEEDMCLYFRKLSFKQLAYLTGILVLVDQGTKALVRGYMHAGNRIPLIDDFLFIAYVQNYRGFSWFVPDLPQWVIPIFFTLRVVIVFMAFPVYLFYTQTVRKSMVAVIAVLGISAGVIGNLLDDIFMPFTTDFLQVFNSLSANFR